MNNFLELYNQLVEIAQEGDEEKVRNFIVENFEKFPEDIQRKILGLLFEEAVDKTYAEVTAFRDYFSELLESYQTLEKIKELLEKRKEELELKGEA